MELTGMKKNNFLLVSFLAMAMTFSMASCSGNDDPDSPDIVNPGGILLHAGHDVLDMGTVQFQESGFDHLCRKIITGNADGFPGGADRVQNDLHDLVQLLPVYPGIVRQDLIVDVLQNDLPIDFSDIHPIHSHPRSGGRGI